MGGEGEGRLGKCGDDEEGGVNREGEAGKVEEGKVEN